MRIHSFGAVIDDRARVLICGTAPSVKSLEYGQFYGHPQNFFWPLVYRLFGEAETDPIYENRIAFLQDHRLALWDVIESCERDGSLDVNIKAEVPNPIPELVKAFPGLRCIAFNGSKAHDTFRKHFRDDPVFRGMALLKLPSTSPIPTPKMRNLEDRLAVWRQIVPYANDVER